MIMSFYSNACSHNADLKNRLILKEPKKKSNRRTNTIKPFLNQEYKSEEPVEIKESNIKGAGKGLFTRRDIQKGEIIGFYDGIFLSNENYNHFYEKDKILQKLDKYLIKYNKGIVLGFPEKRRKFGYCQLCNDFNITIHDKKGDNNRYNIDMLEISKKNNCSLPVFYAIKDIKKGDELFFDYGREYWKGYDKKDHKITRISKKEYETILNKYNHIPEKENDGFCF